MSTQDKGKVSSAEKNSGVLNILVTSQMIKWESMTMKQSYTPEEEEWELRTQAEHSRRLMKKEEEFGR